MAVLYKFSAGLRSFIYAVIPPIRRPSYIGRDLNNVLTACVGYSLDTWMTPLQDALFRFRRSFLYYYRNNYDISTSGTLLTMDNVARPHAQIDLWRSPLRANYLSIRMYALLYKEVPKGWSFSHENYTVLHPDTVCDYPLVEMHVHDGAHPEKADSIMLEFGRVYCDTPVILADNSTVFAGDIAAAIMLKRAGREIAADALLDDAKIQGLTREDHREG